MMMLINKMMQLIGLFTLFVSAVSASIAPEKFTGLHAKPLVYGRHSMVITNNPWASRAASRILKQGGNAVDAAVAAAFVLGLTEPSSSGLGGGGFALTYVQSKQELTAFDGRETAPQSATPDLFLDEKGHFMPFEESMLSYKSVGVPSEVALLHQMHRQQGKLKWKYLIEPAIELATNGFPISPRLHGLLVSDQSILIKNAQVKAIYFTTKGQVKPIDAKITNPAYANTLTIVAKNPHLFYTGKIAYDIVNTINQIAKKKVYSLNDFSQYSHRQSSALCTDYRGNKICSTPFASGGVTTLEMMNIYANASVGKTNLVDNWAYYFLEAAKLAYADRNQYIADPAFVAQPLHSFLAKTYLSNRSKLVTEKPLVTPVLAGTPEGINPDYAPDSSPKGHGTTSMAIVDSQGNAVSMTLTIEHQFGSHLFVDGFFLNNELTDFSLKPTDKQGKPIANRVEPLKRPRSAIAPTMVFNRQGQLIAISGSPGGSPIICYVAKNLIQMLDFNKNPAEASALSNLCALNNTPMMESGADLDGARAVLNNKNQHVNTAVLLSGAVNIKRSKHGGWYGAADPRREGLAIGD